MAKGKKGKKGKKDKKDKKKLLTAKTKSAKKASKKSTKKSAKKVAKKSAAKKAAPKKPLARSRRRNLRARQRRKPPRRLRRSPPRRARQKPRRLQRLRRRRPLQNPRPRSLARPGPPHPSPQWLRLPSLRPRCQAGRRRSRTIRTAMERQAMAPIMARAITTTPASIWRRPPAPPAGGILLLRISARKDIFLRISARPQRSRCGLLHVRRCFLHRGDPSGVPKLSDYHFAKRPHPNPPCKRERGPAVPDAMRAAPILKALEAIF